MRSPIKVAVVSAVGIPLVVIATVVLSLRDAGGEPDSHALGYPRSTTAARADPSLSDEEAFTSSVLATAGLRTLAPPNTEFSVTQVRTSAEFGVLFGEFRDTVTDAPVPTEPMTVLGRSSGSRWDVVLPDQPEFCPTLQRVPDSLLTLAEKSYFIGCEVD